MDRKLTLGGVIQIVVAYGLLLIFFLAWPLQLIKQPVVSGSSDRIRWELDPVYQTSEMIHEFRPQFEYLDSISFYINNEWEDGTYISISCYLFDQNQQFIMGEEFLLDASAYPGYFTIPVEQYVDTSMNYVYLVHAQNEVLHIASAELKETSAVENIRTYVNNIEQQHVNAVTTFAYKTPVTWPWIMAYFLCSVFFVGIIGLAEKKFFAKKEDVIKYSQDGVIKMLCKGTILIGMICAVWAIYPLKLFGKMPIDNALYIISIIIAGSFLLYVNKKVLEPTKFLAQLINKKNIKNYVQSFCFGMAFIQTCEYVNATYEYIHQINMRQMIVWLLLALLTMIDTKQLTRKIALLFSGIGVCSGVAYYIYYGLGIEAQESALVLWDAYQLCLGVIILYHVTRMLFTKKITKLSIPYATILVIMWTLLFLFDQEKVWMILWIFPIGLFYGMVGQEEDTTDFLQNISTGIIISFLWMVGYCLIHRPFHYYIYTRYSLYFHTVTITSMYLVLVCSVTFIGALQALKKNSRIRIVTNLLLFGMAISYLLFTMSRTGNFTILIIMGIIIVCMIWFGKIRDIKQWAIQGMAIILTVVLSFPVWFSATRIVPAVINDPIYLDLEENAIGIALIKKGESLDSQWYITIEKFLGYSQIKFGVPKEDEDVSVQETTQTEEQVNHGDDIVETVQVATVEQDATVQIEEAKQADTYSNGRVAIWKGYWDKLNWDGHKDMGIIVEEKQVIHAHNSFLQIMYDHGIMTGIFFCVFYIITALRALVYYLTDAKSYKRLVPLGIIGAFGVVSLAEWAIHPCIPIGLGFLMSIAPLMKKIEWKKDEQI